MKTAMITLLTTLTVFSIAHAGGGSSSFKIITENGSFSISTCHGNRYCKHHCCKKNHPRPKRIRTEYRWELRPSGVKVKLARTATFNVRWGYWTYGPWKVVRRVWVDDCRYEDRCSRCHRPRCHDGCRYRKGRKNYQNQRYYYQNNDYERDTRSCGDHQGEFHKRKKASHEVPSYKARTNPNGQRKFEKGVQRTVVVR